jgi:hypothetical protein
MFLLIRPPNADDFVLLVCLQTIGLCNSAICCIGCGLSSCFFDRLPGWLRLGDFSISKSRRRIIGALSLLRVAAIVKKLEESF